MDLMLIRRRMMSGGVKGIPEPNYLRFTALVDNSSVKMSETGTPPELNLEYRINKGAWTPYIYGNSISLGQGDFVEIRNSSDDVKTQVSSSISNSRTFSFTGNIYATGNVMSLLDKTCESVIVGEYGFYKLFNNAKNFDQNINFPILSLTTGSLRNMFAGSSITSFEMTVSIPNVTYPAVSYPFRDMLNGSSVLRTHVTIIDGTYGRAIDDMFTGCTKAIEHHLNTLIPSIDVFTKNTICESIIIDDPTPPTITARTFTTSLNASCIIYVPDDSVNAYKAAQYWSDRANYIKGISETPYLTFVAKAANSSVSMQKHGEAPTVSLEYSIDGLTWNTYTVGDIIPLASVGSWVKFKGVNTVFGTGSAWNYFVMDGEIDAYGDLTSISNGVGGDYTPGTRAFIRLFENCTSLRRAPDLPTTTLGNRQYYYMFLGCKNLNYIKTSMTKISANQCLAGWVSGVVNSTGIFVCPSSLSIREGDYGIPPGWTRVDL